MSAKMDQLVKKKKAIEQEISEYGEVLEAQGNIGMNEPLIDKEGYPRADIDLYSVRAARQKIICLQNDYKALMKEIEEELYRIHANAREEKENQSQENGDQAKEEKTAIKITTLTRVPFAKIDRVDPGSPAFTATLSVGDQVLQFGSIQHSNFKTLQDVGKVVQHSIDKPVCVIILRDGKEQRLMLIPQKWSGRGLLGCNIVAL